MSGHDLEPYGSRDGDIPLQAMNVAARPAQLVGVRGTTRSFPIDPVRGAGIGGDADADDTNFFVIRSPGVEPYHCNLHLREGYWRLTPRDGVTRLNGRGVNREARVLAGDRIQVGPTVELRFELDATDPDTILTARFEGAAATDIGLRPINEDAFVIHHALCAVADGIGGGSHGELASALALQVLKDRFASRNRDALAAARAASQTIWEMASRAASHRMGTTLTAASLEVANGATILQIVHAGDSRAYLMRSDGLRRVTSDHRSRRNGRALSRALGLSPEVDYDCHEITPAPGDRIILVTDGISDVLDDAAIARLAAAGSPTVSAKRLVRAALRGQTRDNATALVADVVPMAVRGLGPGRRRWSQDAVPSEAPVGANRAGPRPEQGQPETTRWPASGPWAHDGSTTDRTLSLGTYPVTPLGGSPAMVSAVLALLVAIFAAGVAALVWTMTSDLLATAVATAGWTGFAWLWTYARRPAVVVRRPWRWGRSPGP